jgi:hypothetical protein
MRNTAQFFRINWKGHKLTVEAYVSGNDVEIENIGGISLVDMYFECIGCNVGEIETLVAEANASQGVDEDAIYERLNDK